MQLSNTAKIFFWNQPFIKYHFDTQDSLHWSSDLKTPSKNSWNLTVCYVETSVTFLSYDWWNCQAQPKLSQASASALAEISCISDSPHQPPPPLEKYRNLKFELRQPQGEKTSIDLNGRQPKWKTTSMKDNLHGRQPQWKTTSMEDNLNRRQPQCKTTI